jgi:hypothetical protein
MTPVLVFDPKSALPYGAKVSMDVAAGARNTEGLPLAKAAHAIFHTARRGVIPVFDLGGGDPITGGGAVGGGSWGAVETYYLGLMNCTRTGGWVTSSRQLQQPRRTKRRAAQARSRDQLEGQPTVRQADGDLWRLQPLHRRQPRRSPAAAPATQSYRWAENIGCRSGGARAAVLGSHLFFQSEKSYNGGHYVNLMNPAYTRVGIGVWVLGRTGPPRGRLLPSLTGPSAD